MFFTCPCCGFKTLSEETRGSFEICVLCDWEDDDVQLRHPDLEGGANSESLREAQQKFIREQKENQFRGKSDHYEKDTDWKPLESVI